MERKTDKSEVYPVRATFFVDLPKQASYRIKLSVNVLASIADVQRTTTEVYNI